MLPVAYRAPDHRGGRAGCRPRRGRRPRCARTRARCASCARSARSRWSRRTARPSQSCATHDPRIAFAEPDRTLQAPGRPVRLDRSGDRDPVRLAVRRGPGGPRARRGRRRLVDDRRDRRQRHRRQRSPISPAGILPGYDATGTDGTVTDNVGHGTFVAGLVAMVDGNGIGGKGIAGAHDASCPIRASIDSGFRETATIAGHHLGGRPRRRRDQPQPRRAERRPCARPGDRLRDGRRTSSSSHPRATTADLPTNPIDYPAAYLGGVDGGWSIGLSVGRDDAEQPDRALLDAQRVRLRRRPGRRRRPAARSASSRPFRRT